jgi:hypothetical protein
MLETEGGESVEWRWRKTMTVDGQKFVGSKLDGVSNRDVRNSDRTSRDLPANMHSGWVDKWETR